MAMRAKYPTDLADAEWKLIERAVPKPKPGGRPAKYARRDVVDAIRYVVRSGCVWRLLPHDFPPWNSVFKYFTDWKKAGLWKATSRVLLNWGGGVHSITQLLWSRQSTSV